MRGRDSSTFEKEIRGVRLLYINIVKLIQILLNFLSEYFTVE
jgi:hypothetical protein